MRKLLLPGLLAAMLLATALAAPAAGSGTAMAGVGRGQAAFTFCIDLNKYEFSFAGTQGATGIWSVQATLVSMHPQCFPPPLQTFAGPFDASTGGCGLTNANYILCLPALGLPGEQPWRICPANVAVCDELNTLYYGTVLATAA